MDNNNFGKNLKRLRAEGNETQELLAMKLKVDKSLISHWEHGRRMPNDEYLEKIAKHFKISVEELFGGVDMKFEERLNEETLEFHYSEAFEVYPIPRINFEKTRAFGLFKEAMKIDKKNQTGKATKDEIVEMAHNYWEAFDKVFWKQALIY